MDAFLVVGMGCWLALGSVVTMVAALFVHNRSPKPVPMVAPVDESPDWDRSPLPQEWWDLR